MNIYLAASYERRLEIAEYAKLLREDGHNVTSHWLTGEGEQHTEQWCSVAGEVTIRDSKRVFERGWLA